MARILLVSDIHANLTALDAVLADAAANGFDAVWSLGDTVGYGPQPSECLSRLKDLDAVAVAGNHELAALGQISVEDFNPYARAAALWTARNLTDDAREYALALPQKIVVDDFTLVHGTPRNPIWEYLVNPEVAEECVNDLETDNCVNGHTHMPAAFHVSNDGKGASFPVSETGVKLMPGTGNWLINPGSVGQPRDHDPRAAYAIFDDETRLLRFHRVEYEVLATQRLMQLAGLPAVLYQRLARGW